MVSGKSVLHGAFQKRAFSCCELAVADWLWKIQESACRFTEARYLARPYATIRRTSQDEEIRSQAF